MSTRALAREAALERRIGEMNVIAHCAGDGIHMLEEFISDFRGVAHGEKIEKALSAIEWAIDKLHFDLDRIADLGDLVCKPLDGAQEPAEAPE